ncbi:MAG: isopentenyl-diphosphate Delta-isomerase [Flavipsychrobacter sp.]
MIISREEKVICVNEQDEYLGLANKMQAHIDGTLHRAFSVFIMNDSGEMLLQQRAKNKYHSPGLWSNACCSHPRFGESTTAAAHRRMREEMGFDCSIEKIFTFRYKAEVGQGLIENEYDHIYIGNYSGEIIPNKEEVASYKYVAIDDLYEWMKKEPQLFTAWFKMVLPEFIENRLVVS